MTVALRHGLSYPAQAIGIESEDSFEGRVVRAARLYGWHGFHIRFSQAATRGVHVLKHDGHQDGWGFPDWLFAKEGQPLKFRELKTELGQLDRHQKFWQLLLSAAGADVGVWRPRDYTDIVAEFAGSNLRRRMVR